MKLIVGLGNPGEKYKKTRHNAGFLAADKIVSSIKYQALSAQSNFYSDISQGLLDNKKVILAKPQTFMNESGKAVRAVLDYYKIKPEDIIVIHDDLDIPLGEYKISKNKNSGGHKGVQSIIDYLGTKDFTRVRVGIEIENRKIPTEKFVLEKFNKEEMETIESVIEEVCGEIVKNISA
jgi:peptidyl-tRNA hydrolase, PTH1 family